MTTKQSCCSYFFISFSFVMVWYSTKGDVYASSFCVVSENKDKGWGLCPELLFGDCLELMQEIPEKSVDLICCDLPYQMTNCKWDIIIPFDKLWEQYNRILKPDGVAVLFSAQPFTTKLIHSNLKNYKYCWYWVKPYSTGFCFAKYQPMRRVEDICVFYRKGGRYFPQGLKPIENPKPKQKKKQSDGIYSGLGKSFTPKWTNYPTNILNYAGVYKNRLHPTQKPVELLEYLIKTYTKPGEVVLDNCMGSGSCGEAAINTGRKFIGIEKDERFYQLAKERLTGAV